MSCTDIFFSNSLPIIGSMDIGLKLPKLLESKHGFFILGHIKDDFKNFGISQLFNKSIIILEKIGVIVLAIFLRTEMGIGSKKDDEVDVLYNYIYQQLKEGEMYQMK